MSYNVPEEFAKAGIKTPEEATDYIADIIGFVSARRMHDSALQAQEEGRTGEQAFYKAVRDILIRDYEEADRLAESEDPDDPQHARDPDEDG